MSLDRETIDASYRYCRRMSRRAGSSFHAGFMLLPAEKRRAMWALYAFMHHTDDLADGPPTGSPRDALAAWRAALELALNAPRLRSRGEEYGKVERGEWRVKSDSSADNSSFIIHHSSFHSAASIFPALADAVRRFRIPPQYLYAVIDGVNMDLDGRRYETFDELRQYCERVASAVGLACIHIWGFRGPEAFEPARAAGIALQLTNILRDLKEDAAADRVYLPLADMRECGYSVDDLRAGTADERLRRLIAVEVARAERLYVDAAELLEWLEPAGQRIFGITTATYRLLLRKIAGNPEIVLQRRVRLGRWEKLRLFARWALMPPRKADLL